MSPRKNVVTAVASAIFSMAAGAAFAASHNDAPLINMDPPANITDVYVFVGKGAMGKKVLNVIVTLNPLEDPGNGVNYYRFDPDILYQVHINKAVRRDGQPFFSGSSDIRYQFRFRNDLKNPNTILSYGLGTEAGPILRTGDARQNFTQSYQVFRVQGDRRMELTDGIRALVPPVNVGPRTTPNYYSGGKEIGGVTIPEKLDSYTQETIYTLTDGTRAYCGQREDAFYADVPAIFDFLGVREPGKDGFSGYNVHTLALEIPIDRLVGDDDIPLVGVFATTSRPRVQLFGPKRQGEDWVQVGRMGNPLFNEALVALLDKDRYNRTLPTEDRETFDKYARNCELAFLLNAVFGTQFQVNNRTDLVGFFMPDVLKVDLSTDPVRLAGQRGFNRLTVFGGDTVKSAFTGSMVPSGWPNGRRLGDDVVDIALTAIASGPSYETIVPLGDNMSANDMAYHQVFPYAGTPFGGPTTTLR
jgi:hypothetical protein